MIVDLAVPSGVTAQVIAFCAANGVINNDLELNLLDEDNNGQRLGYAATGATITLRIPSPGAVATATNNAIATLGLILGPGSKLSAAQSTASAATATLTISVWLLMSAEVQPTWDISRSTNAGSVTLAASTISAANTLQAVYL